MAISVKDIQEKEFATQASNGYNVEQVDDFLDALAEQLGAMIRDNMALQGQLRTAQDALAAANADAAALKKRLPDYKEEGYFRNLEKATREALIAAQRIADEAVDSAQANAEKTVADAKARAEQMIADAKARAEKTVADAEAVAAANTAAAEKNVAELTAKAEELHTTIESYRENFKKVIAQQMAVLQEGNNLLG